MADPDPAGPPPPANSRSPLWLGGLLFLVTLAASAWFVDQRVEFGERVEQQPGHPADAGTAAHDAVRADLRSVRDANPAFRFVYLMRPLPGHRRKVGASHRLPEPKP